MNEKEEKDEQKEAEASGNKEEDARNAKDGDASKKEDKSPIERAEAANKRGEELAKRIEAANVKHEKLIAKQILGGKTEAGQTEKKEEISDIEYAEKVERGEVNPLKEDGFID